MIIRFENVLNRSLQDVLKTSWRRLQNVLNTSWRCLEDIFKTFWRRLEDVLKTLLQEVLKTSCKTSWRGLEGILKTSWRCMTKTIILVLIKRRLLKTYNLGKYIHLDQDVFWRRRRKTSSRRCQDVFIKTNVCWEFIKKDSPGERTSFTNSRMPTSN